MAQTQARILLHPDTAPFGFFPPTTKSDVLLTQLSLKAGLRTWKVKAQEAVHSEMLQLHHRNTTFTPLHWGAIPPVKCKEILESHMFLKEKQDGKIKGRTPVVGGNKQRDFISKEDASQFPYSRHRSSPTYLHHDRRARG
jgi:hypothetical protein